MRSRVLRFLMLVFVVFIVGACGNGSTLSQDSNNTSSITKDNTSKTKKNKKSIGEYVFYCKEDDGYYYMNIKDKIEIKYKNYNWLLKADKYNKIWLDTNREQFVFKYGNDICIKKLNTKEDYFIVDTGELIDIVNGNYILYSITDVGLFSYDLKNNKKEKINDGMYRGDNKKDLYIKNDVLTFIELGNDNNDNLKLVSYNFVTKKKTKSEVNIKTGNRRYGLNYINVGNNGCVYTRNLTDGDKETKLLCKVTIGNSEEIIDSIPYESKKFRDEFKRPYDRYLNIYYWYVDETLSYTKETEFINVENKNGKSYWNTTKENNIVYKGGRKKKVESINCIDNFSIQRYKYKENMKIIEYKENNKYKLIINNDEYDSRPEDDNEYAGKLVAIASDNSRVLYGKYNNGVISKPFIINLSNNEIDKLNYDISYCYIFDKNNLLTTSYDYESNYGFGYKSRMMKVNEYENKYGIYSIYDIQNNDDYSKILFNNDNGLNMYDNGTIKTFTPNIDGYALTNNFNLYYGKKDGGLYIYLNDEEIELIDSKVYINTYEIIKD